MIEFNGSFWKNERLGLLLFHYLNDFGTHQSVEE